MKLWTLTADLTGTWYSDHVVVWADSREQACELLLDHPVRRSWGDIPNEWVRNRVTLEQLLAADWQEIELREPGVVLFLEGDE